MSRNTASSRTITVEPIRSEGFKRRSRRFVLRLFAAARETELGITGLAALLGALVGLGVIGLHLGVAGAHVLLFGLPWSAHLGDLSPIEPWRAAIIPALGGLVVGIGSAVIRRIRPNDIVDPIEANALHGGRMSLTDSLNLGLMAVASSGFGASVGMEAAYTQIGAGLCSRIGRILRLRREDLRTMVGCGAAAAIAAAYNAPMAGAFYGFELIIGSYALNRLGPVVLASLSGILVVRVLVGSNFEFGVVHQIHNSATDYVIFAIMGLICAGLGIAVMKGATRLEAALRQLPIPRWLRPFIGGAAVGAIAYFYPRILGSGHGGIYANLHIAFPLAAVFELMIARCASSAISIASGFRGGLFSSSLFLGGLLGNCVAMALSRALPELPIDATAYMLVGMGSVGAAIVGAPVTMILLVLELTGDFSATTGVMVGVLIAAVAVRNWFGFSFSTWRLHQRGLKIRTPEDIGWIRDLTVRVMMRSDPPVAQSRMALSEFRKAFPPGTEARVAILDGARLIGVLDVADLREVVADDQAPVGDLVRQRNAFLLPGDDVKSALEAFSAAKLETLPVVDNANSRTLVGMLNEADVLRRYAFELERRRGDWAIGAVTLK